MDLRDRIEAHKELITDRLDPDFGLLDKLLASRSLTRPETADVKAVSHSFGRSGKLLEYVFDRGIYEKFMDALIKTQQTHLTNFILGNGERFPQFGDDWPLTEREISILDTNQGSLVDLLETCELLRLLYSHKVVNNRQRDFVSSKTVSHEKNEALLEILRRTSLHSYNKTIICLHLSKQSHIADLLKEGGAVVRVRSELETESDVNEVEDELITKFIEMLGDHSLRDSARTLECTDLRLIAAKRGNSIILYFFCQESAELVRLQEMQTSGRMANVVREMFNETLSRAQVINFRTSLYDEDFSKCELGFRRDGTKDELEQSCDEDDGSDTSSTAMHDLPLELLDMILAKVYGHSSFMRTQLGQPTDDEIFRSISSVDFCWFQRVIRRRFKNIIWRNLKELYGKCYKRFVIYRNTRLYLMENIQTKGLLNRLRSIDCLTDIQTRLANREKDKSRQRNGEKEDLLHLAKSLDVSRYSTFVRCLRESKQTLCAKVVTNGGVVVKAEIQCSHLKKQTSAERQMVKTLNDLRDNTRSMPAPLERLLNRLKAENIEILDSLLDRNPVVWLWCHSASGLTKLQKDSDLVLKLFNFETIARPSQIVKAKTVNIDSDRFRKEVGEMDLRDLLEAHNELITNCLDPDFGLLDELLANRSLTRPEIAEVAHSYRRSEKLLEYVSNKGIYGKFLDALRNTQQTHLANFILSNGERCQDFGDDWPLTEREISSFDINQRFFCETLKTRELLRYLYSHKVVNNRQRYFVSSRTTSHEKNEALLEILRKTSVQNYKITIHCLHLSKQNHIADVLKEDRDEMDLRDRIEAHKELITDRLDPDFGLLDELLVSRSLTRSEVTKVKAVSDWYGRSKKLMKYVCEKGIYEEFLDVLRRTQQTHLRNFILSNGERCPEFGDDWPLTEREISILDTNQRSFVDLLETCDLLRYLYSYKVVNNRQKDFVSSKTASHEKNEALLEILRRISLQNYKRTIDCLQLSHQSHIADELKEGRGILRHRLELETQRDVNEDEDEILTKITEILGDRSLKDSARLLESLQLRLIAAKKGN